VATHARPAVAILEETQAQQAGLVGLATHGNSGIRRLLLGSVADKVLRGAATPVLLYHPQAEGQGKFLPGTR
jgi:nucleotide-binding universal stress UspA family protein